MNNIHAVFQSFRCPNCDTFLNRTFNLERHLTTCSARVKNVYPKNVYQTQGTLFDKLDSFGIEYTNEQTIIMNLALFNSESICVQEESFKDTDTTKWIGKHIPISVSISSNLVKEPNFLCNSDPHHLVTSFIAALENLALQSKAIMKKLFSYIETTIKIKLSSILEKLTQRHNRREQADFDDCDDETCTSTQFLQIRKKQLIDLQEHLERYCNVLPVFGFNSANYGLNLIKSYLLPILVNERNIEPTVIKKAKQFISFKFGDIQLLDIMNFLGGETSLDSFLKAYKTSQTKGFFPYEWFDHPDKMQNRELPPYDASYSKLRSFNPLETEYTDYVNLLKSGLSTEQAVIKLKQSKPPLLELIVIITCNKYGSKSKWAHWGTFCDGITIKILCQLWRQCKKWLPFTTTKISICWSLVVHYQTWLTVAYTNLPTQKLIPSQRRIKTHWKKFEKTSLVAHLSFLHAKQLLMKLLSESLQIYANLFLGLMPANYTPTRCVNPCPPVLIRVRIWIQKRVDSHFDKRRPVALKIWSCLIFNVKDLIVKLRASTLQADERKLTASVLMGFDLISILCLEQWVAFIIFVPVKSCVHLSLKKIWNVAVGEEDLLNWDEAICRKKVSLSLKCGIVSRGGFTRQPITLNYIPERISPTDYHLQNNNS